MDCPTCRSLFSQSFDGRLAGERRQDFAHHVQACAPCDSEFALYRRVFSTIQGLPDGEAQPFQAPAEVPGAFASVQSYSARPRFARVAAGFLILIGLVGTHVLVFQWSRDHASHAASTTFGSQAPPATPPLAVASMSSPLLRDHVDATDLFIKTISKLPDDAAGRDLARADWAASGLPQLTKELRSQNFDPADRWRVDRYLQSMEDEFVPKMRALLEGENLQSVVAIRDAAMRSRVRREHLDGMKMLVASLPRGPFFVSRPLGPEVGRLNADGRLLLASKQARLAGQLPAALDFLQKFESDFRTSSTLNPAAVYLQFDTLAAAGRFPDALNVVRRSNCVPCSGTQDQMNQVVIFIEGGRTLGGVSWPVEGNEAHYLGVGIRVITLANVMKSEPFVRPLAEEGAEQPAPKK